jgi:hypothetical protein
MERPSNRLNSLPGASISADLASQPKTVKNRIHWDITVLSVASLVGAGATVLREPGK